MTIIDSLSTRTTSVERGLIHDLRNLFGVVASAKHMLADGPAGAQRATLLAAIEDAAQRGGQLTSNLLARASEIDLPTLFDIGNRLLAMAPMIRAIAGHNATVRFDLTRARPLVKLVPALFEAAILELVANASAALLPPGRIVVRLRLEGKRVRVTIADDGVGMDAEGARLAFAGHRHAAARGTGLGRVRHFARTSHGAMRLRSRAGRGTVVALTLPMALDPTVDEPAVRVGRRSSPRTKGLPS
ncbi:MULTISPECIES: ATP-binding protein [unclassified Sphingomonas]|uniref:ATP-binding protein n=1 Tax=unclassified Sphingomonas TaxID=196159 RepID=UPI0006FC29C9|nr:MULTISPECIES: HAMP domain-containing sensor histidine kinase [unclassified Sphingomonas]KQX23288.1 hypothetical protein ASD17_02935 [Sphingomonas sp. Root1294]KQY68136.1 hypothetical protein ASD39_05455 [Sphingomonas sp. Root50]KRB91029.1 hypothetical protein ASE22_12250 [Sphingomonas sp. Root720]